jgi:hypothetical protein
VTREKGLVFGLGSAPRSGNVWLAFWVAAVPVPEVCLCTVLCAWTGPLGQWDPGLDFCVFPEQVMASSGGEDPTAPRYRALGEEHGSSARHGAVRDLCLSALDELKRLHSSHRTGFTAVSTLEKNASP